MCVTSRFFHHALRKQPFQHLLLFQYSQKSKLFGTISYYTLNLMKRSMKAARWQWTDGVIKILVRKNRLELSVLEINSEKFKIWIPAAQCFPTLSVPSTLTIPYTNPGFSRFHPGTFQLSIKIKNFNGFKSDIWSVSRSLTSALK